jgi:hypothetical protein
MKMTRIAPIIIILVILLAGCSSGNADNVTAPDSDATSNLPTNYVENDSGRSFLGSWVMELDTQNLTAKVVEDRTNDWHFNVTGMIPQPGIHINSWDPWNQVIDVDVTVNNTYTLSGYDVRTIIYTDDIGHLLVNADNWTELFDIPPGDMMNPFKAFAKDEPQRFFGGGTEHTENLQIHLPGGNGYVQFAIDASYPSNCTEPYQISTFHQGMLLSHPGADAEVTVEVFDWQEDVAAVWLHCPEITGVDEIPFIPEGPVVWSSVLVNDTGAYPGTYEGFIYAESGPGIGGLYLPVRIVVSEIGIVIEQVNVNLDGNIVENSAHGSVTLNYFGEPEPCYFNLGVNDEWVLENVVVLPHSGVGVPQSMTYDFPLFVPDGTDVPLVDAAWSLDFEPIPDPPMEYIPFDVSDREVVIFGGKYDVELILFPPDLTLPGMPPIDWVAVLASFYNQDCEKDECVPVAVSNSLKWLADQGEVTAGKDTSTGTMKTATGWAPGGCGYNWDDGKGQYMDDNGYGVNTEGIPPDRPAGSTASAADCDAAIQALKDGKDVELDGAGHVARVVAMTKNADGTYDITVAHDTEQGKDGGTKTETVKYDPSKPNPVADGGWAFDGAAINGFVAEK